ncbi:MAG: hypothetical protein IJE72_01170 [Clostridia bacterium]|nr:hypothetical protein [Clostridia bacterium]
MNKRNLFVRIVAILLCAIMVLGVGTAAITAFAAGPDSVAAPNTGSQPMLWVVIAVVAAIAVIAGCLIIPKVKK